MIIIIKIVFLKIHANRLASERPKRLPTAFAKELKTEHLKRNFSPMKKSVKIKCSNNHICFIIFELTVGIKNLHQIVLKAPE